MKNFYHLKYMLSCILLLCFVLGASAQGTYVCNEAFKKSLSSGWSVAPAHNPPLNPTWCTDTGIYVSNKYAAHGFVPVASGDTAELVTPFFDCSSYQYVVLKFSHICKVLPCDISQIQYQEQGLGTNYQWKPIPKDAYQGNSIDYKTKLGFDHSSYSDWRSSDTFAKPSNSWYKQEIFDLSDYVSYSKVRFRFIIRKGSYAGSFVADGWRVDDFQLFGSAYELKPPVVAFTSNIPDTVNNTGPFVVNAKVATRTVGRIKQPYLHVVSTYNKTVKHDSLKMKATVGDSLWTATIPQHYFGTAIQYYIIGRDSFGNSARANAGVYLKFPGGYDSNSVAMYSIDSPGKVSIANPQYAKVTIKNKGINNLTSAVLHWELNGVYQGSKAWKGNLPSDFNDTMTLGSYVHRVNIYDTVRAWVSLPNNVIDKNTKDDTLQKVSLGCASNSIGTYKVGPNGQFKDLDDAIAGIQACGAGGDITLAFESGTYTMTGAFKLNTSFMNAYKLTITSQDKHRDSVIFNYNVAVGAIQLDSMFNVTFSHVTINNATSSGHVVAFTGDAENITFYRCHLHITGSGTSGTNCCLGYNDKGLITHYYKNIAFIGNLIEGGCRNWLQFDPNHRANGFRMDSNEILGAYDGSFTLYNADNVKFNHNYIEPKPAATQWPNAIYMNGVIGDSICGNFVNLSKVTTSQFNGPLLNITGDTNSSQRMLIANNVLIGASNTAYRAATARPVYLNMMKADFVHNSIYNTRSSISPTAAYTSSGIFALSFLGSGSDYRCIGNQVVTHDGKNQYALWIDPAVVANGKFYSDYNNYSCNGTILAYYNNNAIADLNALRTATGCDTHSINVPVKFIDSSQGLSMDSYLPFMMPNIGITTDFENTTRDQKTSMGAYTIVLKNNDASLQDFAQTSIIGEKNCDVYVTLSNPGVDTLTSVTIQWMEGGTLQTPYKWTGKLAFGACDTVKIGSVTPKSGSAIQLTAWVENPNNNKDENSKNDTISLNEYVCKGVIISDITIGPKGDFATFDDALMALNTCGIGAPIRIKTSTATWKQITISGQIKGASKTNTITLMPDTNATLTIDAGASTSLIVNGAAFWTFEDITIGNTANGLIGVEIKGQNEDVTFRNCRIYANKNATTSSSAAVWYANASNATTYPVELRFVGNSIQGGYYNMYFTYTAGTTAQMAKASVYIDSNNLSEAYCYGIYTYYHSAIKSLRYNTITNRSSSSTFYGVYSYYYAYWDKIEGNRMNLTASGSTYGFYLYYYNQYASYTASKKAYLINNEIIINSKAGTKYGIYLYYPSGFWEIHHNSIYVKSGAIKYGINLYNSSTSYKINATRNLVFCDSSGTNYPLYISSTTYAPSSYGFREYNNLYSSTNVAYIGGAITSVSALQTASKQDANTVSILPAYDNMSKGLQLKSDANLLCPLDTLIATDIDGMLRTSNTAMGCYNAASTQNAFDLQVSGILSPDASDIIGIKTPLVVEINNLGDTLITSANIHYVLNGVAGKPFAWTGKLSKNQKVSVKIDSVALILGKNSIRVFIDKVNGKTDMFQQNDTIDVNINATQTPADAALVDFYQLNIPAAGSNPISVIIKNVSTRAIDSADIFLSINGTLQTPYKYQPKTALVSNMSDTVNIGNFNIPAGNNNFMAYIRVKADGNHVNDTIFATRYVCGKAAGASFVIGNSANADYTFADLDTLFNLLAQCGGGNDATLKFESGTYTLSAPIEWNTSFMQGGRLIITSLAGNRDSVIFQASAGVVNLNNMRHVTFDRVTLQNGTSRHVINFTGPTEYVTFYKCAILGGTGTAGSNSCIGYNDQAVINTLTRHIHFIGNLIDGGCRNRLQGSASNHLIGIRIDSNVILNSYDGAMCIDYGDSCSMNFNFVRPRTGTQWPYGLRLVNGTIDSIYGNHVAFDSLSRAGFGGNAISFSGTGTGSKRTLIANNVLLGHNDAAYSGGYSVVLSVNGKVDIMFNSVYNTVAATGNTAGAVMLNIGGSTTEAYVYGNQFITYDNVKQFPIRVDANAVQGKVIMDYNNYYTSGQQIAEWNGNAVNSISALQALSKGDTHSICIQPNFVDVSKGLELTSYGSFLCPSKTVINDFKDTIRGKITAMGAYDAVLRQLDATLLDFDKTTILGAQSCPVYVTLMNAGLDSLKSAEIGWAINGVAQKSVSWKGNLGLGASTVVSLGNITATVGSKTTIVAWVYNPNNSNDMNIHNDTISMSEYVCANKFSGTYTVGGSNPDFTDFDDAVFTLNSCGLTGPVTLKFRSGTYKAIKVGTILGTNDTMRITVMPDSAAKVSFDGGSGEPGILLSNAANWNFIGINAGNTANGTYGVLMEGPNSNITFRDCGIYASTTATATAAAVSFKNTSGSANIPRNVKFIHNDIKGGAYNVYIYYMSGSSGNIANSSISLTENTMSDAYSYGIYSYYYSHYGSISYNTITSRQGAATYYGMYMAYYNMIDTITGNKVCVNASQSGYGIHLYYYTNYTSYGKPGLLANNEIMVSAGSSSTALYLYYPYQTWRIYNNSILSTSKNSVAYGFYLYNSNSGLKNYFQNNIVVTNGSTNYPIYVYSSTTYAGRTYLLSDFNNIYSPTNTAYAGSTTYKTLADWQTAFAQDSNSLSILPNYVDSTKSLELNDYSNFSCDRLNEVMLDIYKTPRSANTTMGCYSVPMFDDLNLKVKNFVKPSENQEIKCYGDYVDVAFSLSNASRIQPDFSKSPLKVHMEVSGAANYSFDTTISTGTLNPTQTDTINLGKVPTMISGTYNIKVILNDTADHHPEDDTLFLAYNANRVNLPYDVNFSTTPAEFVHIVKSGNAEWKVAPKNDDIQPAFGTGLLNFNGKGNAGAISNAVFNSVNIYQTSNPKLSFWFAHNGNAGRNYLSVQITCDEGATYTELGKIAVQDTGIYWKQYDFDLSKFANENCISIIFQAVSTGETDISIDRIRITADKDMTIRMILPETDSLSACHLQNQPMKVVIENLTRSIIPISDDTIRVNVSGANTQQFTYVYNKQLDGFEKDTLVISNGLDLSANGNYYFEAFMQAIDDKSENDTLRDSTLYILQDLAMDTIYGINDQVFKLSGDTVFVTAVAVNNGNIPVDQVLLHMSIDGNEVVCDTIRQHLKAGDTLVHAMSRPYIVPGVSKDQPFYFLEISTDLSCDDKNDNDIFSMVGNVNIPDSVDIQVLGISVATPAKGKTKLAPTVNIANIGNQEVSNIVLHVDVIDSTKKVVASISETVNYMTANESKNVVFTMNYIVPNYTGQYTLKAYVEQYNGDAMQSNDTLSKAFASEVDDTRIRESEELNWSMGQNIPNPAGSITRIPFHLPQDAEVVFSVMSANGQLIYREEINANSGNNTLEFDVNNLANGIYYYSMECKGQRIVKKMNVAK